MRDLEPISIVVVCRDRQMYVATCLRHLLRQTVPVGPELEIILVEQGDSSGPAASGLPIQYVSLPYLRTINKPWMCNVGTRKCRHRWVYHVDCDTVLADNAVERIRGEIAAGFIGKKAYTTTKLRFLDEAETTILQSDADATPEKTWGAVHSSGNPILFSVEYYSWLGGYDEAFWGHDVADLDMIERVYRTDGVIYELPVQGWHQYHGKSPSRTANTSNWRRHRRLRRRMRRDPSLAVRNGGMWGMEDAYV